MILNVQVSEENFLFTLKIEKKGSTQSLYFELETFFFEFVSLFFCPRFEEGGKKPTRFMKFKYEINLRRF